MMAVWGVLSPGNPSPKSFYRMLKLLRKVRKGALGLQPEGPQNQVDRDLCFLFYLIYEVRLFWRFRGREIQCDLVWVINHDICSSQVLDFLGT